MELKPYVDYVLEHKDGTKRIGRWNGGATWCELTSYQLGKTYVVWRISDIVSAKEISFD
ncbi:hypothetical protein vBAspATola_24 [Aeromonas phage vB_AspA_Tola]|nr:hypothetical protein vBAspATola_24 [Aeromonas phage vB_AspA_Tola]